MRKCPNSIECNYNTQWNKNNNYEYNEKLPSQLKKYTSPMNHILLRKFSYSKFKIYITICQVKNQIDLNFLVFC